MYTHAGLEVYYYSTHAHTHPLFRSAHDHDVCVRREDRVESSRPVHDCIRALLLNSVSHIIFPRARHNTYV